MKNLYLPLNNISNYINVKILLPLCLLLGIFLQNRAQTATITFTLLQQPCSNNGILVAYDSSQTPPISFAWYLGGQPTTQVSSTNYDTLYNYGGAFISVTATGTGSSGTVSGYYTGSPPFTFTDSTAVAVCPALGSAKVTITGGTPPFTYRWLDTANNVVSTTNPAFLPGGSYSLVITDSAGCTYGTSSHSLNGGTEGINIRSTSTIIDTIKTTIADCTNGTATVTSVSGGHPPYSYHWSNGANTAGIAGLIMGTYLVAITDSLGCSAAGYGLVGQADTITPHTTVANATCLQNNGQILALPAGGAPPYTYAWNNGQHGQTATALTAGYFTITVTDAHGCIGIGDASVTASTPITVTYAVTPSLCTAATGTATLDILGGAPPYSVQWFSYPAQTGTTATGLVPGNYSFQVTDSSGCIQTGMAHVPPISPVTGSIYTTPAQCVQSNGSAGFTILTGSSPFTYHWSTGATTSTINGLAYGYYTCTVTDSSSCSVVKSDLVKTFTPITLGLNVNNASCVFSADGNVAVTPSGGTTPYAYSWSNGESAAIDTALLPGRYYVYVTDSVGCVQNAWTNVSYDASNTSCYCTLTGLVYDDANGNCVPDSGEAGIQNIMIHCSGLGYAFTNSSGIYSIVAPTGTYTLSEDIEAYYPLSSCQNNAIQVNVTAGSGCVDTNNFANVINPIHDVRIVTSEINQPVAGFSYPQLVVVENNGSITESDIVMGYASDGQLTFTGVLPSLFQQQDPVTYPNWYSIDTGFPSLAPGSSQAFNLSYNVPANIPLSTNVLFQDTVAYTAPISNWLNDYTPWNNVSAFQTTVVGSYDPNEKEVLPRGQTAAGYITTDDSVLNYTVRFQNTGTYSAQNVVVIDTLDPNLNINTLRPGYSNYTYAASATESGAVKFTFGNINLPDSNADAAASIAVLMYSIHLKPNLPSGTVIESPATVYFDYNPGITTNATVNTITGPSSILQSGLSDAFDFNLFPNPANTSVNLIIMADETGKNYNLKLYNVIGDVVNAQVLQASAGRNVFTLNVSSLTPGMYFAEVSFNGQSRMQKLMVMR